MAEEKKHHHHFFHHEKDDDQKPGGYSNEYEGAYNDSSSVKKTHDDYKEDEKTHKRHEHLGELGAATAGLYAVVRNYNIIYSSITLIFINHSRINYTDIYL